MGPFIRWLTRAFRPGDPQFMAAMARRWAELPSSARTPGQVLGRHGVGCEGTHGVFPKCDLACTPCYHSRDANRVRVDGTHTVAQVGAQMGLFLAVRPGSATLTAIDDTACLHARPACEPAQQVWRVTVTVIGS